MRELDDEGVTATRDGIPSEGVRKELVGNEVGYRGALPSLVPTQLVLSPHPSFQ